MVRTTVLTAVLILLGLSGCSGDKPLAPARLMQRDLALEIQPSVGPGVEAAALPVQVEILYRISGADIPPVTGAAGPFSTLLTIKPFGFNVVIPGGGARLLTVQMNDAIDHSPVAVGAVMLDPAAGIPGEVVVELGSLTRNCYVLDLTAYPGNNTYGFAMDALNPTGGPAADLQFPIPGGLAPIGAPFGMADAQGNSRIAYLGRGAFLEYAQLPPRILYFSSSVNAKGSLFAKDDVYVVRLTSVPGAYAFIQVVDPGARTTRGPVLRYRISHLPYAAYERTQADVETQGSCSSTW